LKELLHTNRVLSDVQKCDILNEYNRHGKVIDMNSNLRVTLSPVKRMPDEILALIF
jgi:hypothetical protein